MGKAVRRANRHRTLLPLLRPRHGRTQGEISPIGHAIAQEVNPMQVKVYETGVRIWLSANDTYRWATRPGSAWPCSELSGKRLFAEFDRNGLCDMSIDGRVQDCD